MKLYIRNKPHEPVSRFRLPMWEGAYVHVYIWENEEALYSASLASPPFLANYVCLSNRVYIDSRGEISPRPVKWGEIHLEFGTFGAGVVAHEIQHAVVDMLIALRLDLNQNVESICYLVQKMTTMFWCRFYDAELDCLVDKP